ncbi:MAG TPA: VOC family protein [Prosthecobacter sp.]
MTNQMIFVNLPVKDLSRSKEFFKQLGYSFNDQFCDDTAACLVIGENIHAMLLTEPKFQTFTPKPIADATKSTEVLIALSCTSRAEVDDLVSKAEKAGGSRYNDATDHGFMYHHGFQDPDGHIWEVMWMDPSAIQPPAEG